MGMIAINAQPILDARRRGLKPAELILVSLVGRINEVNHTVYATANGNYNWQWVRGIAICIFATSAVDWRPVARSIARARPSHLYLWDVDREEGTDVAFLPNFADLCKPKDKIRWELDFLPWMDFQNMEFACN